MRLRALPGRRDLVWLPAGRDRLELIATDNLTLQPVTGKFPVVGVWQNGLIVERDGHCAGYSVASIRPTLTLLLGEVEIPDRRGSALAGRLDSVNRYDPATYRGGILSLHYARAQELGPWLDRVAIRGEVVVQFWFRSGEAALTLGTGKEQREERIPEQLRRFL